MATFRPVDPTRQRSGALAKRAGLSFEQELDAAGAWYTQRGRGIWFQSGPSVAGYGPGGVVRITGTGPPDFLGVFDGMPVCIDAKTTHGAASYQHPPKTRHQLTKMLHFHAGGGVAGILIQCRELHVVWMIGDPVALRVLEQGGRVSLRSKVVDGITHHHPHITPTPLADTVRGVAPAWEFVSLLRTARERWSVAR